MESTTKIQKHDKDYELYLFSPREAVRNLSMNLNSSLLILCGDTFFTTAILNYELTRVQFFTFLHMLERYSKMISFEIDNINNHTCDLKYTKILHMYLIEDRVLCFLMNF